MTNWNKWERQRGRDVEEEVEEAFSPYGLTGKITCVFFEYHCFCFVAVNTLPLFFLSVIYLYYWPGYCYQLISTFNMIEGTKLKTIWTKWNYVQPRSVKDRWCLWFHNMIWYFLHNTWKQSNKVIYPPYISIIYFCVRWSYLFIQ